MTTPIIATFSGTSTTNITVDNYTDGTVTITGFTINNPSPILTVCRAILKQSVLAKTYKLQVMRDTEILFTVRSILWGTIRTMDEIETNDQLIDGHLIIPV